MPARPHLPSDYELPKTINGWQHDPSSTKNAHVWASPEGEATVGVFASLDDSFRVEVTDERVDGLGGNKTVHESGVANARYEPDTSNLSTPVIVQTIAEAAAWMRQHAPPWRHPDVDSAAFDPPPGFELAKYYLTGRQHQIIYEQTTEQDALDMAGRRVDTPATLATRKYLRLDVWRGSGNVTVSLAPFVRAHDHQKTEVVDTPEECGIATALELVEGWLAEQRETTADASVPGQS